MRVLVLSCCAVIALLLTSSQASAHCQVPCGIYDDAARIQALREDAATIRKAVVKTTALSKDVKGNINQITRWIATKEEHASRIIKTVAEYFLTQKIKPVSPKDAKYPEFLKRLADHHNVLVWSMKNKQQLSLETVSKLDDAIETMAGHWAKKK